MFSSADLLHLVFANENDVYYCNQLLALNLRQYLWLRLHEQQYNCVYFLEPQEEDFAVRTYGDLNAVKLDQAQAKHWIFTRKAKNEKLSKWLQRVFRAKGGERSAVICGLEQFCDFFRDPDRLELLRSLTEPGRRSGILVLTAPVEAEYSAELLLNAPALAAVGETAIKSVRSAAPCDLYAYLKQSMGDRLCFLNQLSTENLRQILSRILLEDSRRFSDLDLFPEIAAYLAQYLNNPAFRFREWNGGTRLPDGGAQFRALYDLLRKDTVWEQLTAKAKVIREAGGLQAYVASLDCEYQELQPDRVLIRRLNNSWAGSCLNLRMPPAGKEGPDPQALDLLVRLRKEVCAVRNRNENPNLAERVQELLRLFPPAVETRDTATQRRCLYAILFCVQWIYTPVGSSEEAGIEKITRNLSQYVSRSASCFVQERELRQVKQQKAGGSLTQHKIEQLTSVVETTERMLLQYEDLIQASVVQLSLNSVGSITELAEQLDQMMDDKLREEEQQEQPEPEKEPEQTAQEKKKEQEKEQAAGEYNYVLDDRDWGMFPTQ